MCLFPEPGALCQSFLINYVLNITMTQKKVWIRYGFQLIYCLVLFCAAGTALKRPAYNWDMLPYMGVVLSYTGSNGIEDIHRQVYAIAKNQVPENFYHRMVDPANAYRNSVAQDPIAFQSQLPFYIVKPLYTRLAYWFYKMGAGLTAATVWPSAISYCLAGLLFFHWCKKYWSIGYACAGSILVMLSPPLLTAAGLSTPDALSAFLLFTAIYLLAETASITTACVLLLLSVFARLDNVLPAAAILPAVFFANKVGRRMSAGKMVFIAAMLLLVYFAVAGNARAYGWSMLYYPEFAKQLNTSYTANASFDFSGYVALVKAQLTTGLYFSFLSMFLFLTVYYLWNVPFSMKQLSPEQVLAMLFVLIIVVRFLLQPLVTDRLYIPYYLSLLAFLVKKNSALQKSVHYSYDEITV
jgi:hypothetical protein